MENKVKVSVVICVKDVQNYIEKCIRSLLNQSFKDFEIIIIDDGSIDNTESIIKKFNNGNRIKYFKNKRNLGIAKSRNIGLKLSNGEYIFFTDGDCVAAEDWIEQGVKYLKNSDCVGVEGKIYYVSKTYKPTFSDHVSENKCGGLFMTGNMAYKKSVIESIGGFDERYTYFEDRDLGLRAKKVGKICFNPNMIVYHQKHTMTLKYFLKRAERMKNIPLLFKKFRDKESSGRIPSRMWRIINPFDLLIILYPPLVISSLAIHRFKSKEDWTLFPFIWPKKICERLNLWYMCAKEKVFLI
jgi:glycosyltransferase involved in cell wall biosynthesis